MESDCMRKNYCFGAELSAPYGRSSLSGAYNRRVCGFTPFVRSTQIPPSAELRITRQPLAAHRRQKEED